MSEQSTNNPDYLNHHPKAEKNAERASWAAEMGAEYRTDAAVERAVAKKFIDANEKGYKRPATSSFLDDLNDYEKNAVHAVARGEAEPDEVIARIGSRRSVEIKAGLQGDMADETQRFAKDSSGMGQYQSENTSIERSNRTDHRIAQRGAQVLSILDEHFYDETETDHSHTKDYTHKKYGDYKTVGEYLDDAKDRIEKSEDLASSAEQIGGAKFDNFDALRTSANEQRKKLGIKEK